VQRSATASPLTAQGKSCVKVRHNHGDSLPGLRVSWFFLPLLVSSQATVCCLPLQTRSQEGPPGICQGPFSQTAQLEVRGVFLVLVVVVVVVAYQLLAGFVVYKILLFHLVMSLVQ